MTASLRCIGPILIGAFALAVAQGCSQDEVVPAQQNGVISFSPNITETVFALGEGDRVIAVSAFCDFPPEVESLPDAGDYLHPNLERIAMLAPEMMILAGEHEKVAAFAKMNAIQVVHAHMDDIRTIEKGILTIGDALGVPDRAAALWNQIDSGLQDVRDAVADKPKPKVLIVTFRTAHDLNTLFTVGRTSFVSELVDIAGGENIFADKQTPYFEASKESIVVNAPDVIVEFHAGQSMTEDEIAAYRIDWEQLPAIPAVRDGRVHIITESYGLRPGPRVPLIASRFAQWFHPDVEMAGVDEPETPVTAAP